MQPRCWHCGEERDLTKPIPQCRDEVNCWVRWYNQTLLTGDWYYLPDDPTNILIRRCMICLTVWRKEITKTAYCPSCKSTHWSTVYAESPLSPR